MTKFLISIRNAQEARLAVRYPVGVIDLKDPGNGALGRLQEKEIQSIVNQLDDSIPRSIAFGELLEVRSNFRPEYFRTWSGLSDFSFVKFGLAGVTKSDTQNCWKSIWTEYQQSISTFSCLVPVIYSDWTACAAPFADEVLELVSPDNEDTERCGAAMSPHVLIDTFDKTKGSSIDWLGWSGIESLIEKCREAGLKSVVAGSIGLKDIDKLISLGPDYIGLRGAVCRRGREELDESKLAALFSIIEPIRER